MSYIKSICVATLFVAYQKDKYYLAQIGANVRKYRTKQNISQSQLAFEIETSLRQIQRIEKGSSNAGILFYIKIAKVLNVSIKDILDFD